MRGTANNEPVVSQANTAEYRDRYSRTFGDKPVQRGRWIWDETQKKLVRAEDYRPPARALDAPIMAGRFYENTKAIDGEDIGSRRRHRNYMKDRGLAPAGDYSMDWYRGKQGQMKREQDRERRDSIGRILYEQGKR